MKLQAGRWLLVSKEFSLSIQANASLKVSNEIYMLFIDLYVTYRVDCSSRAV
jgi:hypothetical protein